MTGVALVVYRDKAASIAMSILLIFNRVFGIFESWRITSERFR